MAKSKQVVRSAPSSASGSYCPDGGDFIVITLDPQLGSEQRGRRPALVLSPRRYNAAARLCIVCPITNKVRGYPFETTIPPNDGGVTGVVMSDQAKSLSWEARNASYLGDAPHIVLLQTKAKLKALLSIA